jgi:hypothetical protein
MRLGAVAVAILSLLIWTACGVNGSSSTNTPTIPPATGGNTGGGSGSGSGGTSQTECSAIAVGQGASLNGFRPFSSDSLWNLDISTASVDPNSASIINNIGASIGIHADFGAGQYNGSYMGIPYTVVDSSLAPVAVNFTAYGDESDPGPMRIPTTAPIEGYPNPGSGDRHVLVLDKANCFLYELYSAYPARRRVDALENDRRATATG